MDRKLSNSTEKYLNKKIKKNIYAISWNIFIICVYKIVYTRKTVLEMISMSLCVQKVKKYYTLYEQIRKNTNSCIIYFFLYMHHHKYNIFKTYYLYYSYITRQILSMIPSCRHFPGLHTRGKSFCFFGKTTLFFGLDNDGNLLFLLRIVDFLIFLICFTFFTI